MGEGEGEGAGSVSDGEGTGSVTDGDGLGATEAEGGTFGRLAWISCFAANRLLVAA